MLEIREIIRWCFFGPTETNVELDVITNVRAPSWDGVKNTAVTFDSTYKYDGGCWSSEKTEVTYTGHVTLCENGTVDGCWYYPACKDANPMFKEAGIATLEPYGKLNAHVTMAPYKDLRFYICSFSLKPKSSSTKMRLTTQGLAVELWIQFIRFCQISGNYRVCVLRPSNVEDALLVVPAVWEEYRCDELDMMFGSDEAAASNLLRLLIWSMVIESGVDTYEWPSDLFDVLGDTPTIAAASFADPKLMFALCVSVLTKKKPWELTDKLHSRACVYASLIRTLRESARFDLDFVYRIVLLILSYVADPEKALPPTGMAAGIMSSAKLVFSSNTIRLPEMTTKAKV